MYQSVLKILTNKEEEHFRGGYFMSLMKSISVVSAERLQSLLSFTEFWCQARPD